MSCAGAPIGERFRETQEMNCHKAEIQSRQGISTI